MKKLKDLWEVEKLMAHYLTVISQLEYESVMNGNSKRGPEMSKWIEDKVYKAYKTNDSVLIFRCSIDPNIDSVSWVDENEDVIRNINVKTDIIIYGDDSSNLANKIKSNFESRRLLDVLQNEGLCVTDISNISPLSEYKNDTLWRRADFSINVGCEIKYKSMYKYETFSEDQKDLINVIDD